MIPDRPHGIADSLPYGVVPASLGPRRKDGTCRVHYRPLSPPSGHSCPVAISGSFREYVTLQEPHISCLLQHVNLSDSAALQLAVKLSELSIDCGSDG